MFVDRMKAECLAVTLSDVHCCRVRVLTFNKYLSGCFSVVYRVGSFKFFIFYFVSQTFSLSYDIAAFSVIIFYERASLYFILLNRYKTHACYLVDEI
jgi:hypothetical protein